MKFFSETFKEKTMVPTNILKMYFIVNKKLKEKKLIYFII